MELQVKDPKWSGYLTLRLDLLVRECFTILNAKWHLDSGCSKHNINEESLLSSFTSKKGGFVSYGDNNKGNILGYGTFGKSII